MPVKNRAIITILGVLNHLNRDGSVKTEKEKATYRLGSKLKNIYSLSKERYTNMLPVIYDLFPNTKIVPIYTSDAKNIQYKVLQYENIPTHFLEDTDGYIEDEKDFREIFATINTILETYDRVIVDITHGFRHLPILMTINLIITNIQNLDKIEHLIFAKEIVKNSQYEIIDLKEYLDISNIALVLQSFLSTLKVPNVNITYPLYTYLNDFSIHLTSNQFYEIFHHDIQILQDEINYQKDKDSDLFFLKESLTDLELFLSKIEKVKDKPSHEVFLFFADLFLEKEYLLQASTYLIESITHYIAYELKRQNLLSFDLNAYKNQQKLINLIKFNYNIEDFLFPNKYFIDINANIFIQLQKLRDDIADIRHNLAHINLKKSHQNLKTNLTHYILRFKDYTTNNILGNLQYTDHNKRQTVTYLLEQYENITKKLAKPKNTAAGLKKIIEKYNTNQLSQLTNMQQEKTEAFCRKYATKINTLLQYKQQNIRLLSSEEARLLLPD